MKRNIPDAVAYARVVDAFKKKRDGSTPADIVSMTGLPLEKVKELTPVAADEFGARLRVTESGEILYSFPTGFKSRYTGFLPAIKRAFAVFKKGAGFVAKVLFKAWIVVMLVGYFLLFMAIALVALAASVAVSASGSSDDRSSSRRGGGLGGLYLASRIFDLVIRIWFYSELTKSFDGSGYGRRRPARPRGRPLHHAVFSFVFGDGDPNADWETRERKAVLAYIQANRGVISLPEFMTLTGSSPAEAESAIMAYLSEFGGSPEATEDGTVVYRFDEILRRSGPAATAADLQAPKKRLFRFSANTKTMNAWFMVLNGVNLVFGSYFLFSAATIGPIVRQAQITGGSYLYAVALALFAAVPNPVAFAAFVLGIVPISFAALFYLVPAARSLREKAANERIKNENLRKEAYRRVWEKPVGVKDSDFSPTAEEVRPTDLSGARDRIIKELGAYATPDVEIGSDGAALYSFPALAEERKALERYRGTVDPANYRLGGTVFDSHE